MSRIFVCRLCSQDARTFVQPGLLPGRKTALQVECINPDCPAYKRTLDSRDTVEIDRHFIVIEDDPDNLTLDLIQWRIAALQRLAAAPIPQEAD